MSSLKASGATDKNMYRSDIFPLLTVPQVSRVTLFLLLSYLPSLSSLAFLRRMLYESVLLRVSPLYYDRRSRLPQRHRAMPIPLAAGVTSFACERNITTVFSPSYHVAARQHITSRLRDIALLCRETVGSGGCPRHPVLPLRKIFGAAAAEDVPV